MTYLVDTSALVRVLRRQVASSWREPIGQGLVAVCEPVLMEALTTAGAKQYKSLEDSLLDTYPWIAVPDDAWETTRGIRAELAKRSEHQGISVADYLIVATALHHNRVLLHDDGDFETVARAIPELRVERIS